MRLGVVLLSCPGYGSWKRRVQVQLTRSAVEERPKNEVGSCMLGKRAQSKRALSRSCVGQTEPALEQTKGRTSTGRIVEIHSGVYAVPRVHWIVLFPLPIQDLLVHFGVLW